MSDSKDQHEPSMEEILASIRRIISEDGESAAGEEAAPPANAETAPESQPAAPTGAAPPAAKRPLIADVEGDDGDVLLLTEEAEDEAAPPPPPGDGLLVIESDEPPPEPAREPEPESAFVDRAPEPPEPMSPVSEPSSLVERLISDRAAAASLAAMNELVSRSYREPNIESLPMGNASQTLEDLTRELLRPILKTWLDENLPQIVERIVREEIGRLALDAQRR